MSPCIVIPVAVALFILLERFGWWMVAPLNPLLPATDAMARRLLYEEGIDIEWTAACEPWDIRNWWQELECNYGLRQSLRGQHPRRATRWHVDNGRAQSVGQVLQRRRIGWAHSMWNPQ